MVGLGSASLPVAFLSIKGPSMPGHWTLGTRGLILDVDDIE